MSEAITVIIPIYNRIQFIAELKRQVGTLTNYGCHVIAVDDHSNDGTWEALRKLSKTSPNLRVFRNPLNRGAGMTRQLGLYHCNTPYVIFLDSDDTLVQTRIRDDIRIISSSEPDAIIHRHVYQDAKGGIRRARIIKPADLTKLFVNSWHTSGITYRRSSLLDVLGWEDLRVSEDNILHAKVKLFFKSIVIRNSSGVVCQTGDFQTKKIGNGRFVLACYDRISALSRSKNRLRNSSDGFFIVLRKYLFWIRSGFTMKSVCYLARFIVRETLLRFRGYYEIVLFDSSSLPYGSEQSALHLARANSSPLLGFAVVGARPSLLSDSIASLPLPIRAIGLLHAFRLRFLHKVEHVIANQIGTAKSMALVFGKKRVLAWARICNERNLDYARRNSWLDGHLIYNSEFTKARFGLNGIVVRNPTPDSAKPLSQHDLRVGYFGRIEEEKGILELVEAIGKMTDFRLWVFGSGAQLDNMRKQVVDAGLQSRISFHGTVAEAYRLMPLFDIIVMPSKLEPWGRVAFEVLGAGIPLICTETIGCFDEIRNHPLVYPIRECNVDEILRALESVELARKCGELQVTPPEVTPAFPDYDKRSFLLMKYPTLLEQATTRS